MRNLELTRRELLGGLAGLTAAATLTPPRARTAEPESYFLSTANPCANVDQRDLENKAIRLLHRPEVEAARKQAEYLWRQVVAYPMAAHLSRFDQMLDEYVFNYMLKAVNSDANDPRFLRVYMPAGQWFDRLTPGSRWGGDNPDNAYRICPIAAGARYEVHGRIRSVPVADVTYTLVGNSTTMKTLGSLEGRDLRTEPDGRFVMTIDDRAAEGRPNHLQSQRGSLFLFVRDSMSDWARETPAELRCKRIDPTDRGPLTDEQIAQRAAQWIVDDVQTVFWVMMLPRGIEPNTLRTPRAPGAVGGLRSQIGTHGLFRLADDEAMVVTANSAGAAYRSFVLTDPWFLTIEYWNRQSSLNIAQMAPDADGQYTFVVCTRGSGCSELGRHVRPE